jgi:lipooligosaccharide transport system permease protein
MAIDTSIRATDPNRRRVVEMAPFVGVWIRELTLFRRFWRSTTFSSVVEPVIYLLAFGFGIGALVSTIDGVPYIEFIGTGAVATAVLFSSVFTGMFATFVRRKFQRTYDGLLSTPVDVPEVVLAEASWIAAKAGVYGCAPLLVAMLFGLPPSWGMLAVPLIGFVTGFGFALFGIWMSAIVKSIDSFNYVTSALITPLFLLAGTFFPLTNFPPIVQTLAQLNPLYHCVHLVRQAAFGWQWPDLLFNVLALLVFVGVAAFLAVRAMSKRLID